MLRSHRILEFIREAGPKVVLQKVLGRVGGTTTFIGLRCALEVLPPIRPAKFRLIMKPRDCVAFSGFTQELQCVTGVDYVDILARQLLCDEGTKTLYVAEGPDGSPAYAQWLVTSQHQHLLHSHKPGCYPTLAPDEVLLEGAYTFSRFRRAGVMTDAMAQLLRNARDGGARAAFTYVTIDNVASLRGCASVGFVPDHLRVNRRRLGYRSSVVKPIDGHAREIWESISRHPPAT